MSLVCFIILEIYILLKPNLVNYLPKAMVLFWICDQCMVKVIYNTILYILYYKSSLLLSRRSVDFLNLQDIYNFFFYLSSSIFLLHVLVIFARIFLGLRFFSPRNSYIAALPQSNHYSLKLTLLLLSSYTHDIAHVMYTIIMEWIHVPLSNRQFVHNLQVLLV